MAKKPSKRFPAAPPRRKPISTSPAATEIYEHKEATVALRPDVGTQAQFKQKKPAQRYRYDSSLAPALDWDGQNSAREQGEALIAQILDISAKLKAAASDEERAALSANVEEAARRLKALAKPFLNWAGKAERLSFDVPTLPLFVHERLSTKAIVETLTGTRRRGNFRARSSTCSPIPGIPSPIRC
jgi:adenine-specific DNA-methyltransferase